MKNICALAVLLLFMAFTNAQTTVVICPDSAQAKCSELTSYFPENNYGNYGVMAQMVWYNSGNGEEWTEVFMIAFDLSSIPANAIITNASLNLYASYPTSTFANNPNTPMNGPDNAAFLRRITQPWNSYTVNWNTQPSDTSMDQVILPASVTDTQNYLGISVTQLVQDMILYGNNGFKVEPVTNQPNNSMVFFSSIYSDSAFRPNLTITYTTPTINLSLGSNQSVCNGSYIIFNPTINGGIPPLTYSWSSTGDTLSCNNCLNPSTTISQTSTYILVVSDSNNTTVSDTITYTPSGTTNSLILNLSNSGITCSVPVDHTTATVSNGITPINYNWGDGTSQLSASSQSHNYSDAGSYIISVTDSIGCITSAFDTIQNTAITVALSQAVEPKCVGDSTGSIDLSVTGGQGPYTYYWVTGVTSDSLTGVPAGDYSVTVTDANSCSALFYYNLVPAHDIWAYYVYLNPTDANCTNNGVISAIVSGGISPYSYLWNNGDTIQTIDSLNPGVYNLTVTDAGGCQRKGNTIVNFNCLSIITGSLFVDTNNNCTLDSGETPIALAMVTAYANGIYYYGFTDWNGNYALGVPDSGTYYLQTNLWNGFCANFTFCGNANQTIFLSHLGDSSLNNNFVSSVSAGFDLTIHPGWTSADPGFQKEYWVMPYNQSNWPYNGPATVTFAYDSNLIYVSSLPPLPTHDPVAHTLTWNVDSLPYPFWDWYNERFENFFQVPDTLSLGYLLQSDFYITPTAGDCDTSNNHLHFSETVIGSHDPNEKTVEPANTISPNDSLLTYTIHFQNTGTDSTWFITVKDTLSPYLDPATARTLASSAPYSSFTVQGRGVLTWVFNPLRLVDSITNPRGSQGFITFSVQKKKDLPLGTTIRNTAYVYFDYYNAVITNTVSDTVAIPTTVAVADIHANSTISVKAFPNPFSDLTSFVVTGITGKYDFELFDVTGRLTRSISSIEADHFNLLRDDLPAGMYFFRINVAGKQAAYGKLVVE